MKIRFLTSTFALAALVMAPAAFAQTNGANHSAAADPPAIATKVAVLNVRQAIGMTAEGKAASSEMNAKFAPNQTELENIQKQAEDLQQQLVKNDRTWSDEEKQKKNTQLQLLQRRFSRMQDDLSEQTQAAVNEAMDTIGRKMFDVLDKYARENGYSTVIDSSQSTVVYVSPQVDITNDIVRLYDAAHPANVPAAAPPRQPGTNTNPATKPGGTTPASNPPAKKPGGQQ